MVSEIVLQCSVCAWRAECNKKYHFESQGGRVRCPDFTRDLGLKPEEESRDEE